MVKVDESDKASTEAEAISDAMGNLNAIRVSGCEVTLCANQWIS